MRNQNGERRHAFCKEGALNAFTREKKDFSPDSALLCLSVSPSETKYRAS